MADSYSKFDQLSVILQGQTSYPMHGVTYVTEGQILSNYSSFTTTASSAAGMNNGAEEDVMRVVVKLLNYPLFICAMVFNIPLLLLIVFEKSLHKAPFFLIANKSVINTMSAISIFYQCLRYHFLADHFRHHMAGHCKFMATYGVVEYLCYPWVNVLIALERVVMMAYPLNSKSILTLRNKIIAMGIFYAFCAAFLVRAFLYSELTVSAVGRTKCNPGYFWVQSFLPISFTNFILPFVCQIVCYSVIALHIQKTSQRSNVTLVQIRLTKLFFADAIIFFASNLPHQLAMYMDEFGDPLTQSSKLINVVAELGGPMYGSQSVFSPLLYIIMCKQVREQICSRIPESVKKLTRCCQSSTPVAQQNRPAANETANTRVNTGMSHRGMNKNGGQGKKEGKSCHLQLEKNGKNSDDKINAKNESVL
ncbi:cysteinyl leukotriene receptor 1-like [Symsagittifera roscoffensis]|uniref:cysteinyl leukotriene receptor 1-like n=1 Tax=Symsagittifera roscoffensis TaxID=84072 RepID=UPI00307B5363